MPCHECCGLRCYAAPDYSLYRVSFAALALILTYSLIKLVEILRAYDISRNQTTSNGKNVRESA